MTVSIGTRSVLKCQYEYVAIASFVRGRTGTGAGDCAAPTGAATVVAAAVAMNDLRFSFINVGFGVRTSI